MLTEIWETVAGRNYIKNVDRFQYINAAHAHWIKTVCSYIADVGFHKRNELVDNLSDY